MIIYILNETDTWSYKIGHTKAKSALKRVASLQTGCKSKIKLIWEYESEYANRIETMIHKSYAWCRQEGEWFDFSDVNIEEIKDRIKQYEDTIKFLKNENSYQHRFRY